MKNAHIFMLDNYLYFHLAPSAQGIPLQTTESKLNLSDRLSRPKRSPSVTLLQSYHWGEGYAPNSPSPSPASTSVMWLFRKRGVCFSGSTPPEWELPARHLVNMSTTGTLTLRQISKSRLSLSKLKTALAVLTDHLIQKLFASCSAPFNLKKYKWPCASGEDLNMFVPYDVSKMEI